MQFRASLTTVLLAVAVSAPVAAVTAWSVTHTVSQLFDPCVRWDDSGSTQGSGAGLGPHDPCRSVTVNGESKLRAIMMSAMIPGIVLASAVLATIGVAVQRRRLIVAGSILMLCETAAVFTIAPLTLVTGLLYLLFARRALGAVAGTPASQP